MLKTRNYALNILNIDVLVEEGAMKDSTDVDVVVNPRGMKLVYH